ncbi:MAG: hypothetical protein ABIA04_01225 [Pseudomonadota bacterium]
MSIKRQNKLQGKKVGTLPDFEKEGVFNSKKDGSKFPAKFCPWSRRAIFQV